VAAAVRHPLQRATLAAPRGELGDACGPRLWESVYVRQDGNWGHQGMVNLEAQRKSCQRTSPCCSASSAVPAEPLHTLC
jgi:hypothetical protein